MEKLYFEDFNDDFSYEFNYEYEVTEEEMVEIATRFDPQPFLVDSEAAKESIFGGLVASLPHLFAMWAAVGSRDGSLPVVAIASLGFNNLKTRAPVRPGDKLKVRMEVKSLRESKSKPGCGIVEFHSEMFNQNGEVVLSLDQLLLAAKRPQD